MVTAKQIEEMNAHTVGEVLNRVTGLFINFNQDFGATSLIHVQGSEPRHVLVLVDQVPWNFLGGGNAETNSIPVGIIECIEIIKGPASSAWGSSLGAVISIITKATRITPKPSVFLSGSCGEESSQDYRGNFRAGSVRQGTTFMPGIKIQTAYEPQENSKTTAFIQSLRSRLPQILAWARARATVTRT